ncbi:drug resistance transporter Bcr/CflA subfamily domain protein [Burkholderia cepacia]|nr:drug resistance transporter Bcr/CflA subfamily domain protein [Burkholderia cepacia]
MGPSASFAARSPVFTTTRAPMRAALHSGYPCLTSSGAGPMPG